MKILVLNGSPSGENSITLQTVHYLQKLFPKQETEVLQVAQRIRMYEKDFTQAREAIAAADLILFCYPVYTFLVPAQLHRFVELLKAQGMDLSGKYATQITTSKHFYDVTAHEFIRENCLDLGLKYLPGFSADMEDLLHKKGQREAAAFFRHLLWSIKLDAEERKEGAGMAPMEKEGTAPAEKECVAAEIAEKEDGKAVVKEQARRKQQIVVVADIEEGDVALAGLVQAFQESASQEVRVVNLQEFPFAGGCLGCFHCAADGTCIYKDHFDEFLREKIQTADACVYAFTIKDHSMGYRFKLFDDRQFCNGHRTVTMGKPVGYLICGELDKEPNLRMVIEARAQVGGNYLTGIVTQDGKKSGEELSRETERLSKELGYCIRHRFNQPANFYGVGGMKIFRDLIWQMQGMMREDHRFYKEHGFYDFPQKKVGTILGMYLVGFMLNNEKLRSKIGGNMTKGMLLPYQNAIEKAKK